MTWEHVLIGILIVSLVMFQYLSRLCLNDTDENIKELKKKKELKITNRHFDKKNCHLR